MSFIKQRDRVTAELVRQLRAERVDVGDFVEVAIRMAFAEGWKRRGEASTWDCDQCNATNEPEATMCGNCLHVRADLKGDL